MRRIRLTALIRAMLVAALVSPSLQAQAPPGNSGGGVPPTQRRADLERQFRERSAQIVRRHLKLDDSQMARLQTANQQFDRQRVELVAQERQTRQALRAELMSGDSANQKKVGELVDQMLRYQRQRLDLQESEQRELGKFLTPVQRAKYFGLQNQLRKRMMELRNQQDGGSAQQGQRQMMRPRARPNSRRPFR